MSQPVRPELDRAWEQLFNQRGGEGLTIPAQALPVVIMDNNALGPYPPCRSWMQGTLLAGLAANFGYIGILNNDAKGDKSACVIDFIIARQITAQDDWIIGITDLTTVPLSTLAPVSDCATEKDPAGMFGPSLANVQRGALKSASGVGSTVVPGAPITTGTRIDGPWVIPPQGVFFIRPLTIANGLSVYFKGRYYPSS